MAVQIVDPPDYSTFPYDEGWTATAGIDSDDAVDGVLMDYSTNPVNVYPSPGPSPSGGPDANGFYSWQVPFSPDANVQVGHSLVIYCYDAEISGDGATCEDLASQNGGGYGKHQQREEGGSSDVIHKPKLSKPKLDQKTISGDVQWPKGTLKGGVFLVLANRTGNIRKHTRRICVCCLESSNSNTPPPSHYEFQEIDQAQWTHIHVVAVTYRHKTGNPTVTQIKP